MPKITHEDQQMAKEIRNMITQTYRRLRKQISNPEHLSVAEYGVIEALLIRNNLTPGELGIQLNISTQFMSQVLGRLVTLNYIQKKGDKNDKRRTLISMTAAGKKKIESIRHERDVWLAETIALIYTAQEKELIRSATELILRLSEK
jgi:DNA-binding MarR family transcriptional regulator